MHIVTVFGTRPEIIKLVPVVQALRARCGGDARALHTGQHAQLGQELIAAAALPVDDRLGVMRPGQGLDALLARMVEGIGGVLDRRKPDWVVVQGDTATTAAAALAAHNRLIPVAHVEAGLRSGSLSEPWPEEGNRRIVSALATVHFAPTPAAAEALLRENIDPAAVHVTGNTGIDTLRWGEARLADDASLGAAADPILAWGAGRRLALATVHRRELDASALRAIAQALRMLADSDELAIVLPLHPRPENAALADGVRDHAGIMLCEPLDYFALLRLMLAARLILTDSGGIQEEAAALGRPVLVLRGRTERTEGVAAGSARLVGSDSKAIVGAARETLASAQALGPSDVYGDGKAAQRIADVLTGVAPTPQRVPRPRGTEGLG